MEHNDSNIKRNFSIPDNYFEQLEQEILTKTVNQKRRHTFPLMALRPWMKIAASIILLSVIGFGVTQYNSIDETSQTITSAEDALNINDELFTALLLDEDIPTEDETLSDLADFLIELDEFEF